MIVVITIAECVKILREHGMNISDAHLRAGIECGAYPFGVCIPMKQNTFEIYKPLLMKWIEERSIKAEKELTA
ncbi:MAG: hypothetical protein K6C13_07665 [Oscillospiraceae bacterium]|nr:hypothetical protein [Oscillospiraceae bacterium]